MKILLTLIFFFTPFFSQAKTVASYTYLKTKKPVTKKISFEELKRAYNVVKQSAFNAPTPEVFYKDFLRFRMGVEVALNEKRLVKSPNIENQITDPYLKQAFQQELYKAFAELKLKNKMTKLDKTATNLSNKALKRLYSKEPEFNIFYISINHPINPSPKQIKEAEQRAKKIYAQVIKSKKPFLELVALYSDDKANGTLGLNRSRASILPEVYERLKTMKNGSISKPLKAPSGYFIVKLNQKVPFSQANKTAIKANYFNKERTKTFNRYFGSLKRDFKVNNVNKSLIQTL